MPNAINATLYDRLNFNFIRDIAPVAGIIRGTYALADPKLKMRLAELGSSVVGGSPADYGRLLAEEAEKWGKVIRAANIKAEWRRYAGYSISSVLRTTRL